jgi:hypothetical protein
MLRAVIGHDPKNASCFNSILRHHEICRDGMQDDVEGSDVFEHRHTKRKTSNGAIEVPFQRS